jgi:hypothetical protein
MKRRLFKIRRGMKLLMKPHLVVNMKVDGQVLLRMRSLMVRHLTAAALFCRQRANIQAGQRSRVIM